MRYRLPVSDEPGLSIGLGGIGTSLVDLVQLYTGLVTFDGRAAMLDNGIDKRSEPSGNGPLLQSVARWQVRDILRGVVAPLGAQQLEIAYKTGTSYGYRDAWSVGFDGRHVIGVWIGRADNSAVPGLTGRSAAAPVLFEAFTRSGQAVTPFALPPVGAARVAHADLPDAMRRFMTFEERFDRTSSGEAAPQIAYPPSGARIELSRAQGEMFLPLVVKLQGGRPPFRWLANGRPVNKPVRQRKWQWLPDGPGSASLAVIDAAGRTANVEIIVE